ncbi:hypothetical protein CsSME_00001622 [Camellia sinensis var. sinensis]
MAGVNVDLSSLNMRALGSEVASSEGNVVGNLNHRVNCSLNHSDVPGTRKRDQSRSEVESLMGPTANTPRSQVGHLRWIEVVDEGSDKVTDDIQVRLVDDEVRVQPTRGERSGRGYGVYRGGRGRGGRGNLGEGGRM